MVTTPKIDLPMDEIAAFCKKWKITEFALFGSVLREDFRPDSDIDVLVTFQADHGWSLLDQVRMQDQLGAILHRRIDIISRSAIEASTNPIRKRLILDAARTVYAA